MPRLFGRKPQPPSHALETRFPCPVCLGVKMQKVVVADTLATSGQPGGPLTLDHCTRCGGVWFERGEVQRLAGHKSDVLHAHISRRSEAPKPPCHKCRTPLSRDAVTCAACGRDNLLHCPACQCAMRRAQIDGLALDACDRCHGIWFDYAELEQIWSQSLREATERWRATHRRPGSEVVADGAGLLLESMFWAPNLVFYGAHAAGQVVVAGAEAAGGAIAGAGEILASGGVSGVAGASAEAATAAVEIAGDAAGSIFATIAEIIAGIFE